MGKDWGVLLGVKKGKAILKRDLPEIWSTGSQPRRQRAGCLHDQSPSKYPVPSGSLSSIDCRVGRQNALEPGCAFSSQEALAEMQIPRPHLGCPDAECQAGVLRNLNF